MDQRGAGFNSYKSLGCCKQWGVAMKWTENCNGKSTILMNKKLCASLSTGI